MFMQVTSSTEDLSGHLFRCRNMNNSVCLRLNNLSLSRIASVEKLLFVQMLDLSHNELHSTEGTLLNMSTVFHAHVLVSFVASVIKWCVCASQDWRQCNFSLA